MVDDGGAAVVEVVEVDGACVVGGEVAGSVVDVLVEVDGVPTVVCGEVVAVVVAALSPPPEHDANVVSTAIAVTRRRMERGVNRR